MVTLWMVVQLSTLNLMTASAARVVPHAVKVVFTDLVAEEIVGSLPPVMVSALVGGALA
jgi:hypothetical protein